MKRAPIRIDLILHCAAFFYLLILAPAGAQAWEIELQAECRIPTVDAIYTDAGDHNEFSNPSAEISYISVFPGVDSDQFTIVGFDSEGMCYFSATDRGQRYPPAVFDPLDFSVNFPQRHESILQAVQFSFCELSGGDGGLVGETHVVVQRSYEIQDGACALQADMLFHRSGLLISPLRSDGMEDDYLVVLSSGIIIEILGVDP